MSGRDFWSPLKPILVRFKFKNLGEKSFIYIFYFTLQLYEHIYQFPPLEIHYKRNHSSQWSYTEPKVHVVLNSLMFCHQVALHDRCWCPQTPPPSTATRTNCNTDAAFIEVLGKDERIYFSFCVITTRRKQRSGAYFIKYLACNKWKHVAFCCYSKH